MADVENGALQTAIDGAAVGETVVLTSDIVLTSRVTVSNAVTIDLNGYTIAGDINDGYGAIYVGTNGSLTIVDNSSEQTGGITNNVGNAIGNYGSVEIYGGTFTGKYALYNFHHNNLTYGTSVVSGGTFKSADGESPSVANCGDLTINGGAIESIDTTSNLTVNDGIIESLYVGVANYNPTIQSTSINGGYVDALTVANTSTNEIIISGGTFGNGINSQYFADGYDLSYDEGTGIYKVVADSDGSNNGLKVIATSSSRIRDLIIKNGQLIFVQDLKRIAFDFNNTRVFYNQIVELDTENDRLALENPLNGYYFVIDRACLWSYQGEWIQITKEPEEVLFIGVEFPELGSALKLYVNKTKGNESISIWDEESGEYLIVADRTQEISDEDINRLFE